MSLPVFAVHKIGNVWPLSKIIPPSTLSNELVKAETAAKNNKFLDAASLLEKALNLNDSLSKKYLTRTVEDGPIPLQIELAIYDYKFKSPYTHKTVVVDEVKKVIKKYEGPNKEANWWSFRELYVLLIDHYNNIHDYLTMLHYMKIRFELDPVNSTDYPQALYRYN